MKNPLPFMVIASNGVDADIEEFFKAEQHARKRLNELQEFSQEVHLYQFVKDDGYEIVESYHKTDYLNLNN
jgi:hypothetical protein